MSPPWFELLGTLAGALPDRPGVSARAQHVVTGGPEGEVRYRQTVIDGRLTDAAIGDDPDPEVTFTRTFADAVAIERGELDDGVAFMQGRVKVVGNMGAVMALMPLTRSAELSALRQELAARTDW